MSKVPSTIKAIEILTKGPAALEELEAHLKTMTLSERIDLSAEAYRLDIPAPQIVHYDYNFQRWYTDIERNRTHN